MVGVWLFRELRKWSRDVRRAFFLRSISPSPTQHCTCGGISHRTYQLIWLLEQSMQGQFKFLASKLTIRRFPPVRACLFDMDGLLIDSEDIYSLCTNKVLEKYGRPPLPWSIKAQLQGRPGPAAAAIFYQWAQLPVTPEEYTAENSALQIKHFPGTKPLAGVEKLLNDLAGTGRGETKEGRVHIALASSSNAVNFKLKTSHLEDVFQVFEHDRRILGDDPRIPIGRGKPSPDIYLAALKTINDSLTNGEKPITPEECLVFEDAVLGVEAGRRAGMRVVWVPHPELAVEYNGREAQVLAARTGHGGSEDSHQLGEIDDGWAEYLTSLENFPYEKYGIAIKN